MAVFYANYASLPSSHAFHSCALHTCPPSMAAQSRNYSTLFRVMSCHNRRLRVGMARAEEGICTWQEPQLMRELPHGLNARLLPRHVALVMDGNSRWAEEKGLAQAEGHEVGGRTWRDIVLLSNAWGIQALTTFFFSTENWGRPQAEVSALMELFERLLQRDCEEFRRCNIQAHIIGDTKKLPRSLQYAIKELEQQTAQNRGLKLSIAINYGGRYDIIQAIQKILLNIEEGKLTHKDVTEQILEKMLETRWLEDASNVDLVIRTSGAKRLSNFLLWQMAYSEIIFVDAFWPEIDENQYANCLLDFQKRNRRYGARYISTKE